MRVRCEWVGAWNRGYILAPLGNQQPTRIFFHHHHHHHHQQQQQNDHTHTFKHSGIVDVPFLLGSTGHEGDCCTPLDLRNASAAEWTALLARQFLPWGVGPALGERIAGVCEERWSMCGLSADFCPVLLVMIRLTL
jgi:hypothetical protein